MTVEKFVKDWLFEQGLWEQECDAIVEFAKSKSDASKSIRWSDQKEGYPEVFYKALIYTIRSYAIEWLKENNPNHFALFMLES